MDCDCGKLDELADNGGIIGCVSCALTTLGSIFTDCDLTGCLTGGGIGGNLICDVCNNGNIGCLGGTGGKCIACCNIVGILCGIDSPMGMFSIFITICPNPGCCCTANTLVKLDCTPGCIKVRGKICCTAWVCGMLDCMSGILDCAGDLTNVSVVDEPLTADTDLYELPPAEVKFDAAEVDADELTDAGTNFLDEALAANVDIDELTTEVNADKVAVLFFSIIVVEDTPFVSCSGTAVLARTGIAAGLTWLTSEETTIS